MIKSLILLGLIVVSQVQAKYHAGICLSTPSVFMLNKCEKPSRSSDNYTFVPSMIKNTILSQYIIERKPTAPADTPCPYDLLKQDMKEVGCFDVQAEPLRSTLPIPHKHYCESACFFSKECTAATWDGRKCHLFKGKVFLRRSLWNFATKCSTLLRQNKGK
jgi:hypothetical protein